MNSCICPKSRNIQTQTIDAFDATHYLANHGSLERSINLVLQGFIHRHTHYRMHIVISLHCNSFAYIEEKRWKVYVHPNWKHLSTLDSEPFCLLDDCPRDNCTFANLVLPRRVIVICIHSAKALIKFVSMGYYNITIEFAKHRAKNTTESYEINVFRN